jgi:hypothetical protein
MGSTYLPLDWNALICFASKGDLEAVTCLIEGQISGRADIREMTMVRKRFPPDMLGLYGDTPLHAAAGSGHLDVVDYLLKSQADPSAQNDMGQTPLVCAAMQGHDKVISRQVSPQGCDVRSDVGVRDCPYGTMQAAARRDRREARHCRRQERAARCSNSGMPVSVADASFGGG